MEFYLNKIIRKKNKEIRRLVKLKHTPNNAQSVQMIRFGSFGPSPLMVGPSDTVVSLPLQKNVLQFGDFDPFQVVLNQQEQNFNASCELWAAQFQAFDLSQKNKTHIVKKLATMDDFALLDKLGNFDKTPTHNIKDALKKDLLILEMCDSIRKEVQNWSEDSRHDTTNDSDQSSLQSEATFLGVDSENEVIFKEKSLSFSFDEIASDPLYDEIFMKATVDQRLRPKRPSELDEPSFYNSDGIGCVWTTDTDYQSPSSDSENGSDDSSDDDDLPHHTRHTELDSLIGAYNSRFSQSTPNVDVPISNYYGDDVDADDIPGLLS